MSVNMGHTHSTWGEEDNPHSPPVQEHTTEQSHPLFFMLSEFVLNTGHTSNPVRSLSFDLDCPWVPLELSSPTLDVFLV